MVFRSVGLPELDEVAREIARKSGDIRIWLFFGEMGAGKTTLIKAVGKAMGIVDTMSSPTFSIVNEYETDQKGTIYHFDFYRIRNESEAYDIGVDEYFYSGNPCFVEWPEKIPSLIPDRYGKVEIQTENNTHRTIVISFHDGKEENGL